MRAVTWIDSGRPRGALPVSNIDSRLAIDPDRSRGVLPVSGDESRDSGGEGVVPCRAAEARAKTEGDLAGSPQGLVLRTEKKVDEGLSLGGTASLPPVLEDSFSRALIRWEMLEPILPDLGRKSADEVCCVSLWRKAAPEDTVRADAVVTSAGDSKLPRMGLDTVRTVVGLERPLLSIEAADRPVFDLFGDMMGKAGAMGDLDTVMGFACCRVADCSSSISSSSSERSDSAWNLSLSGSRSVRMGSTLALRFDLLLSTEALPVSSVSDSFASPLSWAAASSSGAGAEVTMNEMGNVVSVGVVGSGFASWVENLETGALN